MVVGVQLHTVTPAPICAGVFGILRAMRVRDVLARKFEMGMPATTERRMASSLTTAASSNSTLARR
eukprot:CAMPEP_0196223970 /NCGR_PEP_ID=MMETSP0912-20130531/47708_1 /TAXON_ID=49265 /ORGANISM="Thalassiosira rotula, Strain GSO102" /LENGTH=65 /DNA_ID=CAMNT_0041503159 /DNA_START=43 /DNA_END=236 /DNA_ORIENTATION=-